ncbi:MAG: hypothetical protein FJY65_06585 [Calditrichaeota bacterium]|nr:hypothetical protein [Calditrichota bacterium]
MFKLFCLILGLALIPALVYAETIWFEDDGDFHENFVDDICTFTDVEVARVWITYSLPLNKV